MQIDYRIVIDRIITGDNDKYDLVTITVNTVIDSEKRDEPDHSTENSHVIIWINLFNLMVTIGTSNIYLSTLVHVFVHQEEFKKISST